MHFELLREDQKVLFRDEMLEMMRFSDKEFIPPLSARTSTTQKDLSGSQVSENGIKSYYTQMETQQILCAFEEDLCANGFDTVGKRNAFQIRCIHKSLSQNGGHRLASIGVGNHDLLQKKSLTRLYSIRTVRQWGKNQPFGTFRDHSGTPKTRSEGSQRHYKAEK